MLIYRLLGDDAQQSFAKRCASRGGYIALMLARAVLMRYPFASRSWGISYGINAAAEWKDVAIEAAKAAVILAILERLYLTSNASWLEVRAVDRRCVPPMGLRTDIPSWTGALCAAGPH